MKRKVMVALVIALLVSMSLFVGIGFSQSSSTPSYKYVIAFKQDLPANYATIVANAGGTVLRTLPKLGGLEVASADPNFLGNLSNVTSIQAANREMEQKLDDGMADPAAANGQPITDVPQNSPSFWQWQWDIQKVTHNGDSYAMETGGTVNPDGSVTHKAVVGVIDTGIDANHPDLKANFLGGVNFVPAGAGPGETGDPNDIMDRVGHGTHVAGSIAANGRVKGVGPNLGIRSYRVFPAEGGAYTSWIAAAIIQAADDHVDVINMSIGGFDGVSRYTYQGNKYNDIADILLWKRAINYATKNNVTVVVAAGNESLDLDSPHDVATYMNDTYGFLGLTFKGAAKEVPGQIPGVITVSSSNEWSTNSIAFYSNYGSSAITVAAPGGDNGPVYAATGDLMKRDFHYRTLSTWPTYLSPYFTSNLVGYAFLHGTSMASPKVAGIAAVIKAAHPNYSPSQVEALIEQSSIDLGKKGHDQLYGAGEANIYNALLQ